MTAERPQAGVEVRLLAYDRPVDAGDPHAAFKQALRDSALSDPLPTFEGLAELTGVPVGALLRYALVRWAAEGSEALLALGPRAVERMAAAVADAEETGTDAARLDAYARVRRELSWLRAGLEPD